MENTEARSKKPRKKRDIKATKNTETTETSISFGSEKPKEIKGKKETTGEKHSLSFGGLNIIVRPAEKPDIEIVRETLRFGSITADNRETIEETSSNSGKIRIHGEVPKKTNEVRSVPSRMCQIVEYNSDEETVHKKPPPKQIPTKKEPANRIINQSNRLDHIFNTKNDTALPTSSNLWCWWCCHKFSGPPCYLPTKYDEYRERYVVIGNFCSWSCVKSYNMDIGDNSANNRNFILRRILKKLDIKDVKNAPPRTALLEFGGHLSIEKFREASGEYNQIKPLSALTVWIEPQILLKRAQKLGVNR
tara:strand:- start:947 stop:1861 length:915 start_codon:yes stop_codon:yes gene_type:complete